MSPIQRIISVGFATAAIAAASMPALSWTVWPDVDFEWYANVGRTANATQSSTQSRNEYGQIPGQEEPQGADLVAPPANASPLFSDNATPAFARDSRTAPSLSDTQPVNPTLPATGSNRR